MSTWQNLNKAWRTSPPNRSLLLFITCEISCWVSKRPYFSPCLAAHPICASTPTRAKEEWQWHFYTFIHSYNVLASGQGMPNIYSYLKQLLACIIFLYTQNHKC
jgi:hypothetical protein